VVVICIFVALIIISAFWKISFHTSTLAGALIIMVSIYGPGLFITVPVMIAVGWARVAVRGHTLAQVLAGAALGIVVAGVVFPSVL
jgi:membrane-associated phospholipid phosphatase